MREVRWQLRTRLGVATLVVFDNRRILHGRTAVSSARHPRHLRGCYLVGARWLAQRFSAEVSEPVRLHVPAKRYLCATDSDYLSRLSRASVHTVQLQGGAMSAAEVARFEGQPYHGEAVRVRRWDDQGKVAGLNTPNLSDYASLIDVVATQRQPR